MIRFPKYTVEWSERDQAFVATNDWFPQVTGRDRDCVRALERCADNLMEVIGEDELYRYQQWLNSGQRPVRGPYGE